MGNKLRIVSFCMAMLMGVSMCGCDGVATTNEENVQDVEPLSFEDVAIQQKSVAAEEAAVYNYLSSTLNLQIENLMTVEDSAKNDIYSIVTDVNDYLETGMSLKDALPDDIANYMLLNFAKTPYKWKFDNMEILGVDAPTSFYFVDVTYKTTDIEKDVISKTPLVRGDDGYDELVQQRYEDYMLYLKEFFDRGGDNLDLDALIEEASKDAVDNYGNLDETSKENVLGDVKQEVDEGIANIDAVNKEIDNLKTEQEASAETEKPEVERPKNTISGWSANENLEKIANLPEVQEARRIFESKWGNLDTIMQTQNGLTMLNRLRDANVQSGTGIGQYTYEGLNVDKGGIISDSATMTFRFVLKYDYMWGVSDDMSVQAVYLKDYILEDSAKYIEAQRTDNVKALDTYEGFILDKLQAFKKAEDSSNHKGLYGLIGDYGKYDTYYEDLKEYTYRHFKGFTNEIIGINGNIVSVLLTTQNQERAKGTEMSLPTYQERYIVHLKLDKNDTLTISDYTLLDTVLIGEPLSVIRNVTGTSEQLLYSEGTFTFENEKQVYDTLGKFMEFQLVGDINSTDVFNVVDMGASISAKNNIQSNLEAIQSLGIQNSLMFIQHWEQKSNTYAVIHIKEMFLGESAGQECESTVTLANRNGSWKVIGYTRDKINNYSGESSFPEDYINNADYSASVSNGSVAVTQNVQAGMVAQDSNYNKENYGEAVADDMAEKEAKDRAEKGITEQAEAPAEE